MSSLLKFKTNINCGGCVANVTPVLNALIGVEKWEVDTTSADKVLSIETASVQAVEIVEVLQKRGYLAELLAE